MPRDYRVRFKRPARAREKDAMRQTGLDPYRTQFGAPPALVDFKALTVALAVGLALAALLARRETGAEIAWTALSIAAAGLGLLVVLVVSRWGRAR